MSKVTKFSLLFASASMILGLGVSFASSNSLSAQVRVDNTIINGVNPTAGQTADSTGGIYFDLEENELPWQNWDWDYRLKPHAAENIRLVRNGVTTNLANTSKPNICKYTATHYYLEFQWLTETITPQEYDEFIFDGDYSPVNNSEITFNLQTVHATYIGQRWIVSAGGLEAFDVITLKDIGIGDKEKVVSETAVDYTNVSKQRFAVSDNNTSNSVAVRFNYSSNGVTSDGTGGPTTHIWLRNANSGWFGYHFMVIPSWRVIKIMRQLTDTNATTVRETPAVITENDRNYELEFGCIDFKNSSNCLVYVKVDGEMSIYQTINQVVGETATYGGSDHVVTYKSNVVSMYIPGSSTYTTKVSSVDFDYNQNQVKAGTGTLRSDISSSNNIYYQVPVDDIPYAWTYHSQPMSVDSVKYNGVSKAPLFNASLIKCEENIYYFSSAWFGASTPAVGDTLEVKNATFRYIGSDKIYVFTINLQKAVYDGAKWVAALSESTTFADSSVIEEGSLLANLATWNPDNTKSALKNVDQSPDKLVYAKDDHGDAALYFSHDAAQSSAAEVRFYLPGNAYKAEAKNTQVYDFSFRYRLRDFNTTVGTEGGTTYENGAESTRASSTETSYMIQYVAGGGAKYYCYDANLVADGEWHDFKLEVACPTVNGFNVKLFRFQGEFVIADVKATTYDSEKAAVSSFVAAYMHMSDVAAENVSDTGACKGAEGYYAAAKAAVNALSARQRTIFASDADFAAAYARLQAWAVANGETFSINAEGAVSSARINNVSMTINNSNSGAIAAVALVSALALVAFISLKKKRHN